MNEPTTTEKPQPKIEKAAQPTLNRTERADIIKRVKTQNTVVMNPVEYEQMKILANDFIASGSVPTTFENSSQVLMALQAGKEMGMSPVQAMQSFYIVNGLLNIWGKAVPRQLRNHGYVLNYKDESPNSCTVVVTNSDRSELYEDTFTFADAEASGWTKDRQGGLKFAWKPGINRKLKLRYGALSTLVKTYLPDVLGSVADIVEVANEWDLPNRAEKKAGKVEAKIVKALSESNIDDIEVKPIHQEQNDDDDDGSTITSQDEQRAMDLMDDDIGDK